MAAGHPDGSRAHLHSRTADLDLVARLDDVDLGRAHPREQPLGAARAHHGDLAPEPSQGREMEMVAVLVGDQHHVRVAGRLRWGRSPAAQVREPVGQQRVDGHEPPSSSTVADECPTR